MWTEYQIRNHEAMLARIANGTATRIELNIAAGAEPGSIEWIPQGENESVAEAYHESFQ